MNRISGFAFLVLLMNVVRTAEAQSTTAPAILQGVGIEQKLGQSLPLALGFHDESGRDVRLGDYFHGRPVLLTLVYFKCPGLCTLTLNQLTRSLTALSESAGDQFDVVAVSFDPRETPRIAAEKKQSYLRAYRRPSADDGWHFLTGDQASIDALARAAGFQYRWDSRSAQFAHASALMVVAPDGTLSRYFLGVDYPSTEVRSAIREATRGAVAPPAEAVYFYCFRFDPETGKYGLIINRSLRALGVVVLLGVVGLVASLSIVSSRRSRAGIQEPTQ